MIGPVGVAQDGGLVRDLAVHPAKQGLGVGLRVTAALVVGGPVLVRGPERVRLIRPEAVTAL